MRHHLLVLASALVASAIACGSADRDGAADPAATQRDSGKPPSSIVASDDGEDGEDGEDGKDGGKKDSGSKKDTGAPSPSDAGAEAAFDGASGDASPFDAGSSDAGSLDAGSADTGLPDTGSPDTGSPDAGAPDAGAPDTGSPDAGAPDAGAPDTGAPGGPITGGPCASGAVGATALRVKWSNAGGKAQAGYQVNGLPDKSRWKTSAYGYQIGFTPSYVDPFLASGGLLLDSSDFIDIELSTVGLSVIRSVTLSLHGRSFHTTASGSFQWQTFEGTGATPAGVVSNVTPYAWTSADATTELSPGDKKVLLRIKAGPPSSSLVVSSVELCIDAD